MFLHKILQKIIHISQRVLTNTYLYLKFRPLNKKHYKIIPMGLFCMPRTITTVCHLKPSKKMGEKSYPFDLAFYNDFSQIIHLIQTKFADFYDDMAINEDKHWYSERLHAVFNHEPNFTFEAFKERYDSRIANFYHCMYDTQSYIYFVLAFHHTTSINESNIQSFMMAIQSFRPQESFGLILINNSAEKLHCTLDNVHVLKKFDIDQINQQGMWVERLKKQDSGAARAFTTYIYQSMKRIILNNKSHG